MTHLHQLIHTLLIRSHDVSFTVLYMFPCDLCRVKALVTDMLSSETLILYIRHTSIICMYSRLILLKSSNCHECLTDTPVVNTID